MTVRNTCSWYLSIRLLKAAWLPDTISPISCSSDIQRCLQFTVILDSKKLLSYGREKIFFSMTFFSSYILRSLLLQNSIYGDRRFRRLLNFNGEPIVTMRQRYILWGIIHPSRDEIDDSSETFQPPVHFCQN